MSIVTLRVLKSRKDSKLNAKHLMYNSLTVCFLSLASICDGLATYPRCALPLIQLQLGQLPVPV